MTHLHSVAMVHIYIHVQHPPKAAQQRQDGQNLVGLGELGSQTGSCGHGSLLLLLLLLRLLLLVNCVPEHWRAECMRSPFFSQASQ